MGTSTIYAKLAIIQQSLKIPKDQVNNFGHYRYRTAESILSALKPLLQATGLVLTLSDELNLTGDRYYVKSTARLVDTDTGDSIETYAWAREEESKRGMDSSQITGASSSYARKYALCGLCAINDARDSDETNTGETKSASPSVEKKETPNTDDDDEEAQMMYWESLGFPVRKNTNGGK